MINAKEAKQLYDESGHAVEQFIKNSVEKNVLDAAKSGKRTVTIHLDTCGPFDCLDRVITPFQRAVVSKLKALDYAASIECYGNKYVPRGLTDDDGEGPVHQNFGLIIRW